MRRINVYFVYAFIIGCSAFHKQRAYLYIVTFGLPKLERLQDILGTSHSFTNLLKEANPSILGLTPYLALLTVVRLDNLYYSKFISYSSLNLK